MDCLTQKWTTSSHVALFFFFFSCLIKMYMRILHERMNEKRRLNGEKCYKAHTHNRGAHFLLFFCFCRSLSQARCIFKQKPASNTARANDKSFEWTRGARWRRKKERSKEISESLRVARCAFFSLLSRQFCHAPKSNVYSLFRATLSTWNGDGEVAGVLPT